MNRTASSCCTSRAHPPGRVEDRLRFSHSELAALEAQATSFEVAASFSRTSLAIELPEPEQIDGEVVSAHYFDLLRVAPLTGRQFTEEEDSQPGAHPLVIVSARMWRGRMASDPNVLSRTLPVNGVPLSIIGVMPDGFNGLSGRADLWIPTAMAPRLTYADYLTTPQHFLPAVARLKVGVSLERGERRARGHRAASRCRRHDRDGSHGGVGRARDSGGRGARRSRGSPVSAPALRGDRLRAAHRLRQRREPHDGAAAGSAAVKWRCEARSARGRGGWCDSS